MAARDSIVVGVTIFAVGIALFVTAFMVVQMVTRMVAIPAINSSAAAVSSLNATSNLTNRYDYVIFGLFIGLVLATIITGWFIGGQPIFMILYFIVVVIGVIGSSILSNVWETTTTMPVFGTTINAFPITNHILLNLPLYTTLFGFVGIVVMFARPFSQNL